MCRPKSLFIYLSLMIVANVMPGRSSGQASSTATGISRTMNPAISVNGLFWGQVSRDNDDPQFNRVALQEAEAQLTAIVDPFWKASFTFAVHPAHGHQHEGAADEPEETDGTEATSGFLLDVEEAFIDGRSLPAGLGLRLGRFYLPYGKHAPLHTHQYPFAEAPLGIRMFLGDHGLTETGARLAASVPLPWFSDLTLYGVNGDAEIFDGGNKDLVWGGRWTNLWDLTGTATLELGGSAFTGPDGSHPDEGKRLDVFGVDLTTKWISATRSQGPALNVTGEVILPRPEARPGTPLGWYALAQYRFHRNWWLGVTHGRADADAQQAAKTLPPFSALKQNEHTHGFTGEVWESKVNLTYAPSEFSALRLEVDWYDDRLGDTDDLRFILQWNFTIGSHPAHLY